VSVFIFAPCRRRSPYPWTGKRTYTYMRGIQLVYHLVDPAIGGSNTKRTSRVPRAYLQAIERVRVRKS